MEEKKEEKGASKTLKYAAEILLCILFLGVGAVACVLNFESWLGLLMLVVGLLSLCLNNLNKWLDLLFALIWSAAYAYFSYLNGLFAQAAVVSTAYLVINILSLFKNSKTSSIVEPKKRMKGYQKWAVVIFCAGAIAGSYFLSRIFYGMHLNLLDAICAAILAVSLYVQLNKFQIYFIMRLVAMILAIILWVVKGLVYDFSAGCASIILMFVAFLLFDNVRVNRFTKSEGAEKEPAKRNILESAGYRAAMRKYNQENPKGLPGRSVGVDKDDKRKF